MNPKIIPRENDYVKGSNIRSNNLLDAAFNHFDPQNTPLFTVEVFTSFKRYFIRKNLVLFCNLQKK